MKPGVLEDWRDAVAVLLLTCVLMVVAPVYGLWSLLRRGQ